MENVFEINFQDIIRILISGTAIYISIILYLRVLGKRITSELNNFDWIVTVSVGSTVASTLVSKDISFTEGSFGILILFLLQYIVTKGMFASTGFMQLIKSSPKLLVLEGEFLNKNMLEERILEQEIYAAIRQQGFKNLKDIYAVVLETNSKLSVIPNTNTDEIGLSLFGVNGLPPDLEEELKQHHNGG